MNLQRYLFDFIVFPFRLCQQCQCRGADSKLERGRQRKAERERGNMNPWKFRCFELDNETAHARGTRDFGKGQDVGLGIVNGILVSVRRWRSLRRVIPTGGNEAKEEGKDWRPSCPSGAGIIFLFQNLSFSVVRTSHPGGSNELSGFCQGEKSDYDVYCKMIAMHTQSTVEVRKMGVMEMLLLFEY